MTGHDLSVAARLARGGFSLDVEFEARAGRTVALLGPNGAGKSTTLAVVAGTDEPDRARRLDGPAPDVVEVHLGGRVLTDTRSGIRVPPERRRIGVVHQDHLLFDHLSVLDNVAFGPRSHGRSTSRARADAREIADRMGVGDLLDRRPRDLSGGQGQRVAIARALAARPDVLLFDEPLAALDVESRRDLRRELRRHLDAFPGPCVLVTHEPEDAFALADDIVVLEDGRVSMRGTPGDVRRRPATPYVAALGGSNLFSGHARDGVVRLDDHDHVLTVADSAVTGPVAVTVHPRVVSLHRSRPEGSQRNVWATTVDFVEPLGDTVRVTLGAPLPLGVDVTPGAVDALGLSPGGDVWAAVKATELTVTPA